MPNKKERALSRSLFAFRQLTLYHLSLGHCWTTLILFSRMPFNVCAVPESRFRCFSVYNDFVIRVIVHPHFQHPQTPADCFFWDADFHINRYFAFHYRAPILHPSLPRSWGRSLTCSTHENRNNRNYTICTAAYLAPMIAMLLAPRDGHQRRGVFVAHSESTPLCLRPRSILQPLESPPRAQCTPLSALPWLHRAFEPFQPRFRWNADVSVDDLVADKMSHLLRGVAH